LRAIAEALLKVLEAAAAEERVANDEQSSSDRLRARARGAIEQFCVS